MMQPYRRYNSCFCSWQMWDSNPYECDDVAGERSLPFWLLVLDFNCDVQVNVTPLFCRFICQRMSLTVYLEWQKKNSDIYQSGNKMT